MARKRKKFRQRGKAANSKAAAKSYVLRLYITGQSNLSSSSVRNLLRVCQDHLAEKYDIQVIDICQQPELARADQIIATPTLVRTRPTPVKKFVGNLANQQQLLQGLGIRDEKHAS